VFPGIGLGAILSKSVNITQNMIYASGEALSNALLPQEIADNWLYPDISRIREVSVIVTRKVIRAAQADKMDRELALRNISDEQLDEYIRVRMYDPFREHEKVAHEIEDMTGRKPPAPVAATNGSAPSPAPATTTAPAAETPAAAADAAAPATTKSEAPPNKPLIRSVSQFLRHSLHLGRSSEKAH
jgi:malate dehydrogenase (oxaloacetate-decarboxylating)(NADP+)